MLTFVCLGTSWIKFTPPSPSHIYTYFKSSNPRAGHSRWDLMRQIKQSYLSSLQWRASWNNQLLWHSETNLKNQMVTEAPGNYPRSLWGLAYLPSSCLDTDLHSNSLTYCRNYVSQIFCKRSSRLQLEGRLWTWSNCLFESYFPQNLDSIIAFCKLSKPSAPSKNLNVCRNLCEFLDLQNMEPKTTI